MECPYLRNVTFQKIKKIEQELEEGTFTFSALPLLPLHQIIEDSQQISLSETSSCSSDRHNIGFYKLSIKGMPETKNHLFIGQNKQNTSLTGSEDTDIFSSKFPQLPTPKSLKPLNISSNCSQMKFQSEFQLDLRIVNIQNSSNIQLLFKKNCNVSFKYNFLQIKSKDGQFNRLDLTQFKLKYPSRFVVNVQFKNKLVDFQVKNNSQKEFLEKLKLYLKKQNLFNQEKQEEKIKDQRMTNLTSLINTANTFDILLYQNNRFLSQVQRLITNSEYDHVSMILRSSFNQTYVLDCNSSTGVTIIPFKKYQHFISKANPFKLYYRKFNGNIQEKNLSKLQDFINESIGKKYHFTPTYLLPNAIKSDQNSYFCSQLIAKLLQEVGFMKRQYPPFKYLPKHFGSSQLNLINCFYSDPQEISFN